MPTTDLAASTPPPETEPFSVVLGARTLPRLTKTISMDRRDLVKPWLQLLAVMGDKITTSLRSLSPEDLSELAEASLLWRLDQQDESAQIAARHDLIESWLALALSKHREEVLRFDPLTTEQLTAIVGFVKSQAARDAAIPLPAAPQSPREISGQVPLAPWPIRLLAILRRRLFPKRRDVIRRHVICLEDLLHLRDLYRQSRQQVES
jgi:hypothetical protein